MGASYSLAFCWKVVSLFAEAHPRATEVALDFLQIKMVSVVRSLQVDHLAWERFKRIVKILESYLMQQPNWNNPAVYQAVKGAFGAYCARHGLIKNKKTLDKLVERVESSRAHIERGLAREATTEQALITPQLEFDFGQGPS